MIIGAAAPTLAFAFFAAGAVLLLDCPDQNAAPLAE